VKPARYGPTTTAVCPWWFVRTFDNPARRLFQRPDKILGDLVRPGDSCADIGCGIGYFTIPMARLAGAHGRVTAVDLQPRMLAGVRTRAERAGVLARIQLHLAEASGLHLDGTFDFVLAFWMVHEVPDQHSFLSEIGRAMTPGGRLLLVEPVGHVSRASFEQTVEVAKQAGLTEESRPHVSLSRAAVMTRPQGAVPQRAQLHGTSGVDSHGV